MRTLQIAQLLKLKLPGAIQIAVAFAVRVDPHFGAEVSDTVGSAASSKAGGGGGGGGGCGGGSRQHLW